MNNPLLSINNLSITFPEGHDVISDLSLHINKQETLALVGESGSGKSLTALSCVRLLPSHAKIIGEINFKGKNLLTDTELNLQKIRGNQISYIFQEPMTSLNPLQTVNQQIEESIRLHQKVTKIEAKEIAENLLEKVGMVNYIKKNLDILTNCLGVKGREL